MQAAFPKDIRSLIALFEDIGKPIFGKKPRFTSPWHKRYQG